ncbi:hypothetical protein SAMN00768000_0258 [Sulfobacillus thermosulfidooxidans DSM 9293]|uniref:Uncharacterized protein n=1 Tax=Sulfobacillus thermosulfidooxidans (strain DSM 9293 / VKM B-1269 / AT-1) TaxID=929705 RepID=A0A1W1W6X9_SULTA|nr:hypothetical protein SAMN00768000_0258 [Sulfobacillus thermosulfidooxidans DSM 9293]
MSRLQWHWQVQYMRGNGPRFKRRGILHQRQCRRRLVSKVLGRSSHQHRKMYRLQRFGRRAVLIHPTRFRGHESVLGFVASEMPRKDHPRWADLDSRNLVLGYRIHPIHFGERSADERPSQGPGCVSRGDLPDPCHQIRRCQGAHGVKSGAGTGQLLML